jgi:hypothetical protein
MSTSTNVIRGGDYTWSNNSTWAAATFTWKNAAEGDTYTMTNSDGLGLVDGRKLVEEKREPVQIRFSESYKKLAEIQRYFAEAIILTAKLKAHTELSMNEAVGTFNDAYTSEEELITPETLIFSERETHDAEFVRLLKEYLMVYVGLENGAIKTYGENITASDNKKFQVDKAINEAVTLIEELRKTKIYQRLLAELLSINDDIQKSADITRDSHIDINGSMLHHAGAIISDIIIGSTEVTADIPAGYSDFVRFMPGDYEYTKALVKLALEADLTSDRPMVDSWTYNVDLPDIIKRGNATLSAQNTTINFDEAFYQVPEVTITMKAASGAVPIPNITAVTKEGFSVELRNASGSLVAGTISWQAIGC